MMNCIDQVDLWAYLLSSILIVNLCKKIQPTVGGIIP